MEKWLQIRTFPDYQISNYGRVKNIKTNTFNTIHYHLNGDSAVVYLKYKDKMYGRSLIKLLKQTFIKIYI